MKSKHNAVMVSHTRSASADKGKQWAKKVLIITTVEKSWLPHNRTDWLCSLRTCLTASHCYCLINHTYRWKDWRGRQAGVSKASLKPYFLDVVWACSPQSSSILRLPLWALKAHFKPFFPLKWALCAVVYSKAMYSIPNHNSQIFKVSIGAMVGIRACNRGGICTQLERPVSPGGTNWGKKNTNKTMHQEPLW